MVPFDGNSGSGVWMQRKVPQDLGGVPVDFEFEAEDVILVLLLVYRHIWHRPTLESVTRLEKLVFLLQKETDFQGIGTLFLFEPYLFGPYSPEVKKAVAFLESVGLVDVAYYDYEIGLLDAVEGPELLADVKNRVIEQRFTLTAEGVAAATKLKAALETRRPEDIGAIEAIVLRYGRLPLAHLISYVYRRYPETTTQSIHPAAEQVRNRRDA